MLKTPCGCKEARLPEPPPDVVPALHSTACSASPGALERISAPPPIHFHVSDEWLNGVFVLDHGFERPGYALLLAAVQEVHAFNLDISLSQNSCVSIEIE